MTGRPRAQDVDRHVGARVRELRVVSGLSQQALADLKPEPTGSRRAACSLAAVLRCDVSAFFAGLEAPQCAAEPEPDQRRLVNLAQNYRRIRVPAHRRLLSGLAAALAGDGIAFIGAD